MNKIFKVKRNSAGQSVVTSEIAKSHGRVLALAVAAAITSHSAVATTVYSTTSPEVKFDAKNTILIGENLRVEGSQSIGLGGGTISNAAFSIAIGDKGTSADHATAATGFSSIAIGSNAKALIAPQPIFDATRNIAIGSSSFTNAKEAIAFTPAVSNNQTQAEQNINFPDIDKAEFSSNNYKGSWPNWDNVAQLEYGMSKDQVRELVGSPHFKEGLWGVDQWDFVFNYRDNNDQHQVCQMQVHFDKDMLTTAYHWKGVDCETQASGKQTPAQQTIVNNIIQQMPDTEQLKESFQFSADALFAFDKYGVSDIKAEGRHMLDSLAGSIQAYGDKRIAVFIIGHTDRLGSEHYNFDLSKKRADTVVAYLLSKGVKPTVLNTLGAGELMPVKQCASGTRAQLIECL